MVPAAHCACGDASHRTAAATSCGSATRWNGLWARIDEAHLQTDFCGDRLSAHFCWSETPCAGRGLGGFGEGGHSIDHAHIGRHTIEADDELTPDHYRETVVSRIEPAYIVPIQLKIFTPVGMAISIVVTAKTASATAGIPTANMWWLQTPNERNPITIPE